MPKDYATQSWPRRKRERKSWTQQELGERCGVSKVAINRFERGEKHPSEETARRMAEALDLPVELIRGKGFKSPDEVDDMYIDWCHRHVEDEAREKAERDGLSWEEWDIQRQELEAQRAYHDEDAATWSPFVGTVEFEDGTKTKVAEQAPDWFLHEVALAQPSKRKGRARAKRAAGARRRGSKRRSTRASSSSSDDPDPGEPPPARGRQHLDNFAGTPRPAERGGSRSTAAAKAERAGAPSPHRRGASRAARPRGESA